MKKEIGKKLKKYKFEEKNKQEKRKTNTKD